MVLLEFSIMPVIEFGRTGNTVTVLGYGCEALPQDGQYIVEFAFDDGSHGVQTIVQSAGVNDFETSGHVWADAFAFV